MGARGGEREGGGGGQARATGESLAGVRSHGGCEECSDRSEAIKSGGVRSAAVRRWGRATGSVRPRGFQWRAVWRPGGLAGRSSGGEGGKGSRGR
jgi:hypothetical protein